MPSPRRSLAVVLAVALTLVALLLTPAAATADGERRSPGPAADVDGLLARHDPGEFKGRDGRWYRPAPAAVLGRKGDYFLGSEFDNPCAYGGPWLRQGMQRLGRLVDVIERSGRRVVFTVAPTKSSVLPRRLPKRLPHGRCSAQGIREQDRVVDRFRHPSYLPVRRRLAREHRDTYWKNDPHWTSVGGSVWAKALAHELSPRLGRLQRYAPAQGSLLGLLAGVLGLTEPEVAPAAVSDNGVTVSPVPGQQAWVGWPYLALDHSWTSSPASKTWRGQTLILGDSFSEFAMGVLRPIFRSGRFQWIGHVSTEDTVQAIVDAQTVVIEVHTLMFQDLPITTKSFRRAVNQGLRTAG